MPSPISPPEPTAADRRRAARLIPFLILLALPILLLWRVVFLGEAFVPADLLRDIAPWRQPGAPVIPWNPIMWDGIAEFYPWRAFTAATEHAGYLPLWNPHQFCGAPFSANSQSAIFYPLNALFVLLPVKAAFGASVIVHLFLTGSFLYLFLRRSLGLARASSLIGAVTWQLCSWQVCWLELPTFLCVSTWIPAALSCIDSLSRWAPLSSTPPRSQLAGILPVVGLGVSLGLMVLAGHLQICLYGFLLIASYGIYRLGPALVDSVRRRQVVTGVVLAIAIAIFLSLAQVLPAVELSRVSHRAGGHPNWTNYGSYVALAAPVYNLVTLVLPQIYGNPTDGTYWFQPQYYAEFASYIGLVGLLLAMAGTISTWRRNSSTRFFAVAAVVSMLFALGTPLNALLYFGIPGFAQSGSPARILVLWSLCGAILAAIGAQSMIYERGGKRRLPLIAAAIELIAIVGIAGASLAELAEAHGGIGVVLGQITGETMLWRVPVVALLATAGALYQSAAGKLTPNRAASVILAIVAVDLLANGIGYNRTSKPEDVYPVTPAIAYLQRNAGLERVMPVNRRWSLDPSHPPPAVLPPNGATVYGLYDTQGYDSLFPGQYMGFAAAVDGGSPAPAENGNMVFTYGLASPQAQALAPLYVLTDGQPPTSIPIGNLSQVTSDGDVEVYRNAEARPRFEAMQAGTDLPAVGASAAAPTRLNLSVPVTAGHPATLLIRDQWYPGWQADIDGNPVHITQSPYIFRTLRWTPDTTQTASVRLRFAPSTTFAGMYFLCVGWALALGVAAFDLSRRRSLR